MEEQPKKENLNLNFADKQDDSIPFNAGAPKKEVIDSNSLKDYLGIQEAEKSSNPKVRLSYYISQIKENINQSMLWQELVYFWTPTKITIFVGTILGIFLLCFIFSYVDIRKSDSITQYRLVSEKVSKSAVIKISLPSQINAADAKNKISFNPQINGEWVENRNLNVLPFAFAADNSNQSLYFKPKDDLVLNRYYDVLLDLENSGKIEADFLVVDNPKVLNVFPDDKYEALEDSKVTIVFNRPMIDSSKIGEKVNDVPVSIKPNVAGDFTWISNSTLQFNPSESLISSSNYEVKIKKGFVSLDGIPVEEKTYNFKTRNLRYLDSSSKENKNIVYNEPIRIYFNQTVDLQKMIGEIKLRDSQNKEIYFYARYASKSKKSDSYDKVKLESLNDFVSSTIDSLDLVDISNIISPVSLGEFINNGSVEKDSSIVEIYNRPDSSGRAYLWDLNKEYTLEINKAYPIKGDIALDFDKEIKIETGGIVKDWKNISSRTSETNVDFFDPNGKLSIGFYEDVDISKFSMSASVPISKKEYGQKCSDNNLSVYDVTCQKIPDKKVILVTFGSEVSPGSRIEVDLKEVYNAGGQKINTEIVKQTLVAYGSLSVKLGKNPHITNLSSLVLCSNNPLFVPEKDDFKDYIKSNYDYEVLSWDNAWKQKRLSNMNEMYCPENYFVNNIGVGLMPEKNYNITFNLIDVFGQKLNVSEDIYTSKMSEEYVSIFAMQQLYAVTTPDKVSLSFGAQNINSIDLEICKKTDAFSFYKDYKNRNKEGDNTYNENNNISCATIKTAKIPLSERYWINNYFDVDVSEYFDNPIGNYVIKISNDKYNQGKGIFSFLSVTNLAVAEKRMDLREDGAVVDQSFYKDLKNIYWVTDIKTQEPIVGARVRVYSNEKIIEGLTVAQGLVLISPVKNLEVVVVENGEDSAIVGSGGESLNTANSAYSVKRSYIYTDKTNYEPGEKVNIKGLLRVGYDGSYQIIDKKVNIYITNPKGSKISEQEIELDSYGSLNTSIVLEKDSALGSYAICASDYNCGYFNVLDDTQKIFDVTALSDKEEYVSKDTVSLDIGANYYFGAPVENGVVEYTVSAKNYYFDKLRVGNYNFSLVNDDYSDKFLFKDVATLDVDGKVNIKKKIDLDALFQEEKQSKVVTFDIVIKNSFGQSISIKKSVIFHSGEVYLGVSLGSYFVSKNDSIKVKILSTDVNALVKEVKNIDVLFYKVDWSRSGNNWEKKYTLTNKKTVETDLHGEDSYNAQSVGKEGEYEVRLAYTDSKGNRVYTKVTLYAYGDDGQVGVQLKSDNLNLKTNKDKLKAGDTGEVIIEAPFSKAKALITLERGKIFEYKVVDIVGGFYSYQFKAEDSYAPNAYVSVLLQSSTPAVKFAMKSFSIESHTNKLNVELKTDKDFYNPGDKVKMRVFTASSESNGVPAQVSLSVVGSSLVSADDEQRNPYMFFYNDFPLTVSTSSNIKNVINKENDKGENSAEITGGTNVPAYKSQYTDVTYWKGNITTGNDGNADIVFTLPNKLSHWRAEAIAITASSRIGVTYLNFNTEREVMITSLQPNFIIAGDTFYVGAKILNKTTKKKSLKVSFSSDTLEFSGKEKEVVLNIEKNDSQSVYFAVTAPKNYLDDFHNFKINIVGEKFEDVISQKIITRTNTNYSLSVNHKISDENKVKDSVYVPDSDLCSYGSFSLRAGANASIFLSDSMNYLIKYPYAGSEQVASILKSVAKVKRILDIKDIYSNLNLNKINYFGEENDFEGIIENNLVKIYRNQNGDGGFSFYGNSDSNYYATLKVLDAFIELEKNKKLKNDDERYVRANDYVYSIFNDENVIDSPDKTISAAFILLQNDKYKNDQKIKNAVKKVISNSLDKISNHSLAQLGILVNGDDYGWGTDSKINKMLDDRVVIDARGAFVEPNSNNVFVENYESNIIDTALYLRSLAIAKRDKNSEKIVEWLINSRTKDGAWGSTQNTSNAIEAIVEFVKWKEVEDIEYSLKIKLNNNDFDGYDFNSSKVLNQVNKVVNLDKVEVGKINYLEFDKSKHRALFRDSLYYNTNLRCYSSFATEAKDEGFTITRSLHTLDDKNGKSKIESAQVGNILRVHLEVVVPEERKFVLIEDFIPAGFEILDLDLVTDQKALRLIEKEVKNDYLYPDYKEIKNDRAMLYKDKFLPGVYNFDYYVMAIARGNYLHLPGRIYERNNYENYGQTNSSYFEIK